MTTFQCSRNAANGSSHADERGERHEQRLRRASDARDTDAVEQLHERLSVHEDSRHHARRLARGQRRAKRVLVRQVGADEDDGVVEPRGRQRGEMLRRKGADRRRAVLRGCDSRATSARAAVRRRRCVRALPRSSACIPAAVVSPG